MKRCLLVPLSLLLVSAGTEHAAQAQNGKGAVAQGVTPIERYQVVLKEYEDAKKKRAQAAKEAKTEHERIDLNARPFDYAFFAEKMDQIARDAPGDPGALAPLVWVAVYTEGPLRDRAIETIRKSHILDPGISSVAVEIGYIAPPGGDAILRDVLAKNPHLEAKGEACLALARKLKLEAEHSGSNEKAKPLDDEAGRLYERVVNEFADIEGRYGPLGEIAKNGLFELRYLSVGKQAPEISGEDNEGRTMKLSEFRGKVVVLDFWGEWCGPCRGLYPFERALIKRMEGKPFVFLGINSDPKDERDKVKSRMEQEQNHWRYWVDGDFPGVIGATWGVQSWPTLYVIDAQGVIRYKLAGSTEVAPLDAAVEALVEQTERAADTGSARTKVGKRVVLRYGVALRNERADAPAASPASLPIGRDYRTARVSGRARPWRGALACERAYTGAGMGRRRRHRSARTRGRLLFKRDPGEVFCQGKRQVQSR
jgi:thiol-disulfide isomerase/thioredoxin